MPKIESLVVISPHLDDGVFSCGNLIAAHPHTIVITVFAGLPDDNTPAPEWDQRAGFVSAAAAMDARRHEDREALERLHAFPVWLDFFDSQYEMPANQEDIVRSLGQALNRFSDSVVAAPLGLFHSDHVLVQQAALILWRQAASRTSWLFYEDALYRRLAGLLQHRLASWRDNGLIACPIEMHQAGLAAAKERAVSAYGSQLALFENAKRADLAAPERYWQLQCDPSR